MSTFIKSDQSAPNLLRASPISRSGFVHPDQRVITGLTCTKFQVNWLLGLGEEAKKRFSRWPPWRPTWISNQHDFSYFDLQVTLMFPTMFGVNWPFGSREEEKNRFSRWRPWRPSMISNWNDFSYFWSTSHPDASYQVWSQLPFGVRRRSEK